MNPLDYAPVAPGRVPGPRRLGGRRHPAAAQPPSPADRWDTGRAGQGRMAAVPGVALPPGADDHLPAGLRSRVAARVASPSSRPRLGAPFVSRVPAVDEAGNDRGGIRLPQIAVPLATHTGWNYRQPEIGAPDRLASEIGSYLPLPRTRGRPRAHRRRPALDRGALREQAGVSREDRGDGSRAGRGAIPDRRGRARHARPSSRALRLGHAVNACATARRCRTPFTSPACGPCRGPTVGGGRLRDRQTSGRTPQGLSELGKAGELPGCL